MKSLSIKDLSVTEELDSRAMSAVRGGTLPSYWPGVSVSSYESSFDATQLISQSQNTLVNNGNNVAFAEHLDSNVKPKQTGTNTINF
ncbi:MAG: hypothetical protein JWR14_5923 [Caballeronia sp.]|jgi:hypothetical protein|uniref:hypothetical protein n=1 Tax=Caballeronia sp. TaxID=1931223 RepID=UPI00261CE37A|nr:hypothetical protein [Caballeronia sp.]MDB5836093.1 hypothetical protein [Caballeronia sp.]